MKRILAVIALIATFGFAPFISFAKDCGGWFGERCATDEICVNAEGKKARIEVDEAGTCQKNPQQVRPAPVPTWYGTEDAPKSNFLSWLTKLFIPKEDVITSFKAGSYAQPLQPANVVQPAMPTRMAPCTTSNTKATSDKTGGILGACIHPASCGIWKNNTYNKCITDNAEIARLAIKDATDKFIELQNNLPQSLFYDANGKPILYELKSNNGTIIDKSGLSTIIQDCANQLYQNNQSCKNLLTDPNIKKLFDAAKIWAKERKDADDANSIDNLACLPKPAYGDNFSETNPDCIAPVACVGP